MTSHRARALLAAYGASPKRWPAAERAALGRLILSDPDLRAALEAERALDAALDGAAEALPPPEDALVARMLAGAPAARATSELPLRPTAAIAALAACAVLGMLAGLGAGQAARQSLAAESWLSAGAAEYEALLEGGG